MRAWTDRASASVRMAPRDSTEEVGLTHPLPPADGGLPREVAPCDLDGDGALDSFLANVSSPCITHFGPSGDPHRVYTNLALPLTWRDVSRRGVRIGYD